MRHFEEFNPVVLLVYYLTVLIPVMAVMDPILILTALAVGLIRSGIRDRKIPLKKIGFSAVVVIVMTLINGLLSHEGSTELFFINDRAITLEALRYGFVSGLMLSAAFAWFADFSRVLTGEKIMAMMWRLPKLALLVSMIVRLIPRYLKRYRKVSLAVRINEEEDPEKSGNNLMRISSAVFTWALENSMDTADTMQMRGYASGKRKMRGNRFTCEDVIILTVIGALQSMYFLPRVWHTALMIVLCLLPELYRIKENVKWKIYTLKI